MQTNVTPSYPDAIALENPETKTRSNDREKHIGLPALALMKQGTLRAGCYAVAGPQQRAW
jgi:hypothetical protein